MKFNYYQKTYSIFITACLIFLTQLAFPQQNAIDKPASLKYNLDSNGSSLIINNKENIIEPPNTKLPPQAGYTIKLPENIFNNGYQNHIYNTFVWKLKIRVPNAASLNIYIHNLELDLDQKLFIYGINDTASQALRINSSGTISSKPINGEILIVELNSNNKITSLPFNLTEIGVFLKEFNRFGFGDAGNCEVRINCQEGELWQKQKKGIARILVKEGSTTFWCTGTLINNTKNDGSPLFLTANHCGEYADSIDYSEWSFDFDYEAPNCGIPSIEPNYNVITGAKLLASSTSGTSLGSDFKLLRLNESLPNLYKPYYNGWDRSTTPSPKGVTIHHPQGDVKMISTYTEPLVSTSYDNVNENPNGMYWKVIWAETQNGHGVTEGGSSGSPIFNTEGKIVGSLTGGRASCIHINEPDYYGKISHSWEGIGSDSTTMLSYWLDPTNSGVQSLEGTDLDSTSVVANFAGDPKNIVVGQSVNFINTSYGNIASYRWDFEGGIPGYYESNEPGEIKYNNAGEFDVRLIVSSSNNSDTLILTDYIKVQPLVSPNPTSGELKIAFGSETPAEYDLKVFNIMGQETGYKIIDKGANYLQFSLVPCISGIHIVTFSSVNTNITHKVVVTKE